ncbi:hypothetical protein [uncultured Maribacter sp.]|uniref:hypothetical protein n=1 Tax=uncultured Maribacter sp. TaxID=431308 RepID=UPI002617E31B|nr:hypothetical protein [uncultured Maribacter sp.]
MNTKNLCELTDEELIIEKKNLKKSKIINAFLIGFLASIIAIGIVSSIYGKNYSVIIPLLFPVYFIYRIVSNSNKNKKLETILKERNI